VLDKVKVKTNDFVIGHHSHEEEGYGAGIQGYYEITNKKLG